MVLGITNSYNLLQFQFLLRGHGAGHYQQLQLTAVSVLIAWSWCWALPTAIAYCSVCSYRVVMVLGITNSYSLLQCLFLLRGYGAGHYEQL